jgi:hypothetical protein
MIYGRSCKFNRRASKQYQTRGKSGANATLEVEEWPLPKHGSATVHTFAEKYEEKFLTTEQPLTKQLPTTRSSST